MKTIFSRDSGPVITYDAAFQRLTIEDPSIEELSPDRGRDWPVTRGEALGIAARFVWAVISAYLPTRRGEP